MAVTRGRVAHAKLRGRAACFEPTRTQRTDGGNEDGLQLHLELGVLRPSRADEDERDEASQQRPAFVRPAVVGDVEDCPSRARAARLPHGHGLGSAKVHFSHGWQRSSEGVALELWKEPRQVARQQKLSVQMLGRRAFSCGSDSGAKLPRRLGRRQRPGQAKRLRFAVVDNPMLNSLWHLRHNSWQE